MPELFVLDDNDSRAALRIAVVSQIRLYRDGLAQVLGGLDDVAQVVAFETAPDCLADTARDMPDVILLDMAAVCSEAAARLLANRLPGAHIVAIAVPETEPRVLACVEAGVTGYVPREGSIEDLVTAIRMAARGQAMCSPMIAAGLMRRLATLTNKEQPEAQLTAREFEIAGYVARGMSNRDIADCLSIELCTVKNHVHNMLEKLGATRRIEIADYLRG